MAKAKKAVSKKKAKLRVAKPARVKATAAAKKVSGTVLRRTRSAATSIRLWPQAARLFFRRGSRWPFGSGAFAHPRCPGRNPRYEESAAGGDRHIE